MRWIAAAALVLSALLVVPAAGHEAWGDDARRLEVREGTDGFELRSDRIAGDTHDRVRLALDGGNVRLDFDLMESPGATASEASMRVELERIVEFVDGDGDGAFDASEDVAAKYDQGDLELLDIARANVSSGGVEGLQVTATYSVTGFPGSTVGFRVTAFGNLTTFEGLQQSPVELKLDLVLDNFPYTKGDTRPAIELRVKAEAPNGPEFGAQKVSFTSGTLSASFGWKDTAEVDGAETPVGVTSDRRPDEVRNGDVESVLSLTFAYARGVNIVHDPTFGFDLLVGVRGDLGFYALGAVAAAAVFLGLAVARRGRKAK